nr:hypothetical protein GCM10020092_051680 [Actinoplanes digitatis]
MPPVLMEATALPALFEVLHAEGYTVVGPTARDGAIVVAELESAAELPYGVGVDTEAGRYRLRERDDRAAFGHSAGPQSWKSVLHPARAPLWSADRGADGTVVVSEPEEQHRRYALLGVRPCDLAAIGILDRVLAGGPSTRIRSTRPGGTAISSSPSSAPSPGPPASARPWVPVRTPARASISP